MSKITAADKQYLTISTILNVLFKLFIPFCGNQQKLFAALFSSYHKVRSDEYKTEWLTCQSTIAKILRDVEASLPRRMLVHYSGRSGQAKLRKDLDIFLEEVMVTDQQRTVLQEEMHRLLLLSDNITSGDRAYILDYTTVQPECRITEMVYRMMVVAIYNSNCARS